jgi:chemotaxis regulatin CheY-phosphate phosphatase CheZ
MSGRLQQIITMTDKAANTTMDLAEEIMEDLTQQNDSTAPLITDISGLISTG